MKRVIKNQICFLSTLIFLLSVFPLPYVFADDKIDAQEALTDFDGFSHAEEILSADEPVMYAAASSSGGQWIQESSGRWWYRHADGSYTKGNFEYINGKWYFFNEYGWMQTGWLTFKGRKYYFNADGSRRTGWLQYNGHYYYFNPSDGAMRTGWLELPDLGWFYFDSDGTRHQGWLTLSNLGTFYFNERGIRQTGWNHIGNYWYYMNSRGIMQTGWQKINGRWYYLLSNGRMNTAPISEDVRNYTFYSSGELMSTEICIIRQEQYDTLLCWAASAVMVGKYNSSSKKTQTDVVKHFNNGLVVNRPANYETTRQALNFASENTKNGKIIKHDDITFPGMIYYIDKNHPFIINIKWDGYSGHSMVGAGYNMHYGSVKIVDPSKDNYTGWYDYKQLMKSVIIGNSKGLVKI